MRTIYGLMLVLAFALSSCVSDTGNTAQSTADEKQATEENLSPSDYSETQMPDCAIVGEVLEGNRIWLAEEKLLVVLLADSTTYDENYGDSHRVLAIYSGDDCTEVDRHVLPVNSSPDYAYYLAKINYNKSHNLIGIRGFSQVFCYDFEAKELLPPLKPEFWMERYGEDAQSGMISRLEIWENYLVGYSKDEGTFVFDLSDKAAPKAILPFAEYEKSETEFASLFLLENQDGKKQALLPFYDDKKDDLNINPLLDEPNGIDTNISKSARNNRFLVFNMQGEEAQPLVIDMAEYEKVELPAEANLKGTQAILDWLKSNRE